MELAEAKASVRKRTACFAFVWSWAVVVVGSFRVGLLKSLCDRLRKLIVGKKVALVVVVVVVVA